jgi:hypothetical protein
MEFQELRHHTDNPNSVERRGMSSTMFFRTIILRAIVTKGNSVQEEKGREVRQREWPRGGARGTGE